MKTQTQKKINTVADWYAFSGARPSSGAARSACSNALDFYRHASYFGRGCARGRARSAKPVRRLIGDGGGFGSILSRDSFQKKNEDTLKFLNQISTVYGN